jgi:SAM-dependent methyltransferase
MDSKERFTSRVDHYVRYRPGYPPQGVAELQVACGLAEGSHVADVGSGTGLSSLPFLQLGCRVSGVEPNAAMRAAGEQFLRAYPHFRSLDGSAEATGLEDASVDFVVAGQAFHWFDRPRARVEFCRILRPGGWVALMWNERRSDSTPFLRAYEQLLQQYGTDYRQVDHRRVDEATLRAFYRDPQLQLRRYENLQRFDFAGLRGRLLSSSYAPEEGTPQGEAMLAELTRLFAQYQQEGQVAFEYETQLYYGHLRGDGR